MTPTPHYAVQWGGKGVVCACGWRGTSMWTHPLPTDPGYRWLPTEKRGGELR